MIILSMYKDRLGLLGEASKVLEKLELEVRDQRTSRDATGDLVRHIYVVRDRGTGRCVPLEKLDRARSALEKLSEVAPQAHAAQASGAASSWPVYTQAELQKHRTKEDGIWVSYKDAVYDITDFVANHPGGTGKIMLAAGKALDPFWRIYQQHENRGDALELLAKMRIGTLADPSPAEATDDPYSTDPTDRHPGLIFHNRKPCNAELPAELALDSWLTPAPVWFVRHHHPVPVVDAGQHRLSVDGPGAALLELSLAELRARYPRAEVVATLQCGGNRRSDLDRVKPTSGIPWGTGAISNARWAGVPLRAVLADLGLTPEEAERRGAKHVIFHGLDGMQASIPIEKALSPYGDVLLAYEMNGEPLPPDHGAPLRAVVPGFVGVRNVKWVSRISVSAEEAEGAWQRGPAYKSLSPMVTSFEGVDLEQVPSMQEMPVQSAILSPSPGEEVGSDFEVRGWAWSGGGRGIARVDVSVDGGETWATARLCEGAKQPAGRAWAWTFWEADVRVPQHLRGGELTVLCRATDTAYSTQPERPEPIWNLRGLSCNCWHRVPVRHEP